MNADMWETQAFKIKNSLLSAVAALLCGSALLVLSNSAPGFRLPL